MGPLRWLPVSLLIAGPVVGALAAEEPHSSAPWSSAGVPVVIPEWEFSLVLPSDRWRPEPVQRAEGPIPVTIHSYKREAIPDSRGRAVEPMIILIFRPVPKDAHPLLFLGYYRAHLVKTMGMELVESLGDSTGRVCPGLRLAIGWHATYRLADTDHTVKLIGAIRDSISVQVVMDTTTDVLHVVGPEFDAAIRSLAFAEPDSL